MAGALSLRARRLARRALDDPRLFDRRAAARALRREHVLGIGDSHVRVLGRVRVPHVWFRPVPVKGATASGVLNPNSATQAYPIFMRLLERAQPWQHVLVQLGEVDCGFVIWHRAARHRIGVEEQLAETVETYAGFLARVASMGFRTVTALSAPLPTITDDPVEWGEVANLRREIQATQRERTELTLRFNEAVAAAAGPAGARFVDVTTAQLDPATGVIDRRFVKRDPRDHHLALAPYAALVSAGLRAVPWR